MAKVAVDVVSGCWLWSGTISDKGYGRIWINERRASVYAHRISYELHREAIPAGLVLDHLCRVRHCVNPAHLEPVTITTNVMRGDTISTRHAAKTHCKRGHPFDEANTIRRRSVVGRDCRACHRMVHAVTRSSKMKGEALSP